MCHSGEGMSAAYWQHRQTTRKNELIDKLLMLFMLLVLVAVFGSVVRFIEIGWQPVMGLHLVLASVLGVLTWQRRVVPYKYKAWTIVGVFFLAALGGLLTFGMVGGNVGIWIITPIYAAALINTRTATYLTGLTMLVFALVGLLSTQGVIHANIDYARYAHSHSIWLSVLLSFPLFTYMIILILKHLDAANQALIEELDAKNNHLERLNAVKNKIFSVISHELRTPVQGLVGVLELMQDETVVLDADSRGKAFSQLLEHARGTQLMLENLLAWAKSEMSESNLVFQTHSIADLCSDVCSAYKPIAKHKGIRLDLQLDGAGDLPCDAPSIRIVLSNLLSNAIKFSYPGSVIRICAGRQANNVAISVIDTGVGLSPEAIRKMLDPHHVHTTYGTGGEKGSGLGIRICQQILKQHHGVLQVVSEPNNGSDFTVVFDGAALSASHCHAPHPI